MDRLTGQDTSVPGRRRDATTRTTPRANNRNPTNAKSSRFAPVTGRLPMTTSTSSELLFRLVSSIGPSTTTNAVLVAWSPGSPTTVTVITNWFVAPTARSAAVVHVTSCPLIEHDHPAAPETPSIENSSGIRSVISVDPRATPGP